MKKGIIIVFSAFLCVMVLGILGAETGEIHSETETMKEVGKIFASSKKVDMNTNIYAIGKSGGVITKEEINMATDFYIAVGFDEKGSTLSKSYGRRLRCKRFRNMELYRKIERSFRQFNKYKRCICVNVSI